MSIAYQRVRDTLASAGSTFANVKDQRFMAQCPAHEDHNPSLEVIDKGDKVVLACYAGCPTDDVAASIGMVMADLFDDDVVSSGNPIAAATLSRSYLYEKPNGEPWFYVDRYFPKTFRQRLPDKDPARSLDDRMTLKSYGLHNRPPIIYHAPRLWRAMQKPDSTIYWLDGEKDVETAERLGLVATCAPGFAKWDPAYADFLKGAGRIVMVVDQDKEKANGTLGSGQATAVIARAGFRSVGLKVDVVAPAAGKDFTDHVDAGLTVADFVREPTIWTRPRGLKASELMAREFDPLRWAVNHMIPSGLTILAGPPKRGKTWITLNLSCAVACGGPAMSVLETTQGSVLHLAREDGYRRLQSRVGLIMGGDVHAPSALELVPAEEVWVGGEQGLANMTEWAEEVDNPRMVVIDTLAKVEPEMGEENRRGAYAGNYAMMARYKEWADTYNVAVVLVHHDNKAKVEANTDPFSRISGTRGLTGAADTLIFLDARAGQREATLHVTGRDVDEMSLGLHKSGPLWVLDEPL